MSALLFGFGLRCDKRPIQMALFNLITTIFRISHLNLCVFCLSISSSFCFLFSSPPISPSSSLSFLLLLFLLCLFLPLGSLHSPTAHAVTLQLLTMDAIELTLLLKSIGFRLNSIDYDAEHFAAKRQPGDGASSAGTSPKSQQADTGDHFISVQISCSKSEIVSNLSLKVSGSDDRKVDDDNATVSVEQAKCTACTCPKREPRDDNNSFWEIQSSGTFANRRSNVLRMVKCMDFA